VKFLIDFLMVDRIVLNIEPTYQLLSLYFLYFCLTKTLGYHTNLLDLY